MVIAREGLHPVLVVLGALAERGPLHSRHTDHLTEEVHDLFRAR
jgi:hypothetical protein